MRTGTLLLLLAALPGRVHGVLAGRDLGTQVPRRGRPATVDRWGRASGAGRRAGEGTRGSHGPGGSWLSSLHTLACRVGPRAREQQADVSVAWSWVDAGEVMPCVGGAGLRDGEMGSCVGGAGLRVGEMASCGGGAGLLVGGAGLRAGGAGLRDGEMGSCVGGAGLPDVGAGLRDVGAGLRACGVRSCDVGAGAGFNKIGNNSETTEAALAQALSASRFCERAGAHVGDAGSRVAEVHHRRLRHRTHPSVARRPDFAVALLCNPLAPTERPW